MFDPKKNIVVIYHAQCSDGFASAYAAWKKFGDEASYIPLKTQVDLSETLTNKEIFVVDYSFDKKTLEKLRAENKSVVVIDHHKSAEEAVTTFPENVFDLNHSGAFLTWNYFHPDKEIPELLLQVEDHDLWNFALPDNMPFNAALRQYEFSFVAWDKLIADLRDKKFRADFLKTGQTILSFEDKLIAGLLEYKSRVRFEGYDVWALNVSRTYRSILGHKLATLNEENGGIGLGIVYYYNQGAVHISLRSNGDVDVGSMAEKYGGGGHKNAASIRVETFSDLPFEFI